MTRQYAVYINRPAYPGRGCYVAAKRTDWYRGSHLPGGGLDWRDTLPPTAAPSCSASSHRRTSRAPMGGRSTCAA